MVMRTVIDKLRRSPDLVAPPVIEVPEMAEDFVRDYAGKHKIPEALLRAIVHVESAGDTWAMRFEPGYRWLWDVRAGRPYRGDPQALPAPSFVSQETELTGQKTSWGLMQVMGAVARELGYRGRYLSVLCDPDIGLEYGCRHLIVLNKRFGSQGWEATTAAYNAGSPRRNDDGRWVNQSYIDRIRHFGGLA
jgi:soluble lytic murein transglycosylase-like protein